jgi:outer membrane protein assembly factor BamB
VQHAELELIKSFIERECIFRSSAERTYYGPNGKPYSWMIDFRPLLLDGRMANLVAHIFWQRMVKYWPFQVAGMEIAAIPMITAIVLEGQRRGFDVSALMVRKKRKKHGRCNLIEGKPNGQPIIMVDDVVNSGRTMAKLLQAIQQEGLDSNRAFTVGWFNNEGGNRFCQDSNVSLEWLFSMSDLGLKVDKLIAPKTDYRLVWTFGSPSPNFGFGVCKSTPVIFKDKIIFGSDAGIMWGLDKNNGRIAWWYKTDDKTGKGIISSPIVAEGRVYFGSYSGKLACLDALSGRTVWAHKPCNWIGSSPCYANGKIYIGLEYDRKEKRGALGKFDAMTGREEWTYEVKQQLHGSPVYSAKHNAIVLGTNDSTILVLDADSGKLRSSIELGGPVKYQVALDEDVCVAAAFDGIWIWDFVTGNVLLKVETDDLNYVRPLIHEGLAYVGSSDEHMYIIDLKCREVVNKFHMGEKIHSSACIIAGTIYFGTSAGQVVGLNPKTRQVNVAYQFPDRMTNAVVSDGTLLFVYTYDNRLWAIKP